MATDINNKPVPDSSYDVARRNLEDTDKLVNNNSGAVTNRAGKTMRPLPVLIDQIEGLIAGNGTRLVQIPSVDVVRTTAGEFDGQAVYLTSYYAGSNKGGGVLVWNSTSTAADDGGVTFAVTGVATGRWVRQLEGYVTPEMFGARGDGVADDTAVLSAYFNFLKTSGAYGQAASESIYGLTARVLTQDSTKTIRFNGAGCLFKRLTDFGATVLEFVRCDDIFFANCFIDCQHQIFPNGNHGLVVLDSQNALVDSVTVKNYKNTAVLMYATLPNTYSNNVMRNCNAIGNDSSPANNGLLIAELDDSGIEKGYAENVTGSPGYGLQHKNDCKRGWITQGRAKNCLFAMGWGNDSGATGVTDGSFELLLAEDCDVALDAGKAARNTVKIGKFKSSSVASRNMLNLSDCQDNSFEVGVFEDAAASQVLVRFRSGCSGNSVRASLVKRTLSNATGCAATFDSGVTNNAVVVDNIIGASTAYVSQLITNNSANSTNSFDYSKLPNSQSLTIASDAVTLLNSKVIALAVDTEAASATDDLSTINGGVEGQTVRIRTVSNVRDVTVKHGIGNILLDGQADFLLSGVADTITLAYNSTSNQWSEISRSNNIL